MAIKRVGSLASRTYTQTAYLMWSYYVSDKAMLKSDIKGYQNFILLVMSLHLRKLISIH